jgi:hypothetical protein
VSQLLLLALRTYPDGGDGSFALRAGIDGRIIS